MNKKLIAITIVVTAILILWLATSTVFAKRQDPTPTPTPQRVCFCHNSNHNPVTICTSNQGQINGHEEDIEDGRDYAGECVAPTPSPTATPSATPTPSPTPSPTPTTTPECDEDCVLPTPTPTVTPTPTPEPTKSPEVVQVTSNGSPSNPSAPQCGETPPEKVGANFHIYRNGDLAVAKWFPTGGNKANIYYKQVNSSDWQYSLRDIDNTGYAVIGGLGNLDITFSLQQSNGCAGGQLTNPVIDGAASSWVLFR